MAAARLRRVIVGHFDDEELRTLAHDVGVSADNLRGETLMLRAASLVSWAERNDRLLTLMREVIRAPPNIDWSD